MSPANAAPAVSPTSIAHAERELRELISAQPQWFMSEDGRAPVEVNAAEIDFTMAHGRLIFSSWTERGSRAWRITSWNWAGEKLVLQASRRMGAETTTIELVPRASAKATIAGIAAARQVRCERLAALVASTSVGDSTAEDHRMNSMPPAKIERATVSPGMRRDQPGRYARIILRLPRERVAVTGTVAQSDARNV